jgi:hypothetical protein
MRHETRGLAHVQDVAVIKANTRKRIHVITYYIQGEGFPRNYEYLWSESRDRKPLRVSGPEYVDCKLTGYFLQVIFFSIY